MTSERPPYIDGTNDWTDRTVWMNRLLRDGWTRREGAVPETWERASPAGDLTLAMRIVTNTDFRAYGGRYVIEYAVRTEPGGPEIELGRATWADWDQRGRLIVARDGRLLHWQPAGITEIADFNDQDPRPANQPPARGRHPTRRRPRRSAGAVPQCGTYDMTRCPAETIVSCGFSAGAVSARRYVRGPCSACQPAGRARSRKRSQLPCMILATSASA